MDIVTLTDVTKEYPLGNTTVNALRGISMRVRSQEFISIAGPSGSGKTTALNLIGCIDTPTAGNVVIDGTPTSSMSDKELTQIRHRSIGFIFQSFNLVPVLNVFENVEFPLLLGKHPMPKAERKPWINTLINAVGLDKQISQRPSELSGGQRQRVAIARALVGKPKIVLADEPTANLDSETGESIIELMRTVNRDLQTTFIFSTHDPAITGIADRTLLLRDGLITSETVRDNA